MRTPDVASSTARLVESAQLPSPAALVRPTISVLIPTWRRPDELAACLAALERQTVRPDQIVVTVRSDDELTHARLTALEATAQVPLGLVIAEIGPLVLTAAMNAGLSQTSGDLVALTDDDAEPRPDWLEQCRDVLMSHPELVGVGGRDWQPHERWDVEQVGTISMYGRVVGNHHLGAGPAREVDLLKGVNCCFRGELLRQIGFDSRLRGKGNVTHWELSLCLFMRSQGWRLRYDPTIAVDHRPAVRHDGDVNARGGFDVSSFTDSVHNETLAILQYLRNWQKTVFLIWAAAIGTSAQPGIAQVGRLILKRKSKHVWARWRATLHGRMQGLTTYLKSRGKTSTPSVKQ